MPFEVKTITVKVNKKARKYFKVQFANGQKEYDLVIDDTTRELEVGKNYVMKVQEHKQENPIKVRYVAIEIQGKDIKDKYAKLIAETAKYLTYVEDTVEREGRLYKRGAEIVETNLRKLKHGGIEVSELVERYELAGRYHRAKVLACKETIERYLDYVREALEDDKRWYQKGEDKIRESLKLLRKADVSLVEPYATELKDLKEEFKLVKKNKEITKEEIEAFRLGLGTYVRCQDCNEVYYHNRINSEGLCEDCFDAI